MKRRTRQGRGSADNVVLAVLAICAAGCEGGGSGGDPYFPTFCVEVGSTSSGLSSCECGLYACGPTGAPGQAEGTCVCATGKEVTESSLDDSVDVCSPATLRTDSRCCLTPGWLGPDPTVCACGTDFCEQGGGIQVASCSARDIEDELFQLGHVIYADETIEMISVASCPEG